MWAYISKGIGKGQLVTYHDCHSGGVEVYLYSILTSGLDRGWVANDTPPPPRTILPLQKCHVPIV